MSENGALPVGWRTVRFGEVARNVRDTEREPLAARLERYVGLEHLDPESLHIQRWGLVEEGTSFTQKFVAGQVLFGKRRAYQRKVAVAEFDGVCSGDLLVFEAKEDRLLPHLLPFIVQSDGFFAHALRTSAGSLSPRTRWKDLAAYEFPLPPLDEQRRIAEILWAADSSIALYEDVLQEIRKLKRSTLTEFMTKGPDSRLLKETRIGKIPAHWKVMKVGDLLEICQYGLSIPLNDSGQYPILRMMNFEDGIVVPNDLKYVDLSDEEFAKYQLQPGDILFNRTNSADLVGKVGIYRLEGDFVFASYLVRLRADPTLVLPDYLNYYLNSPDGQRRILSYATAGVSQTNINARNLQKALIPIAPLSEQQQIVGSLRQIDSAIETATEQLGHLANVKRGLLFTLLDSIASD